MTTPNGPSRPDNELTEAELDAVLAAGDAQLLDHVRTHADPAAALTALLDDLTGVPDDPAPAPSPIRSTEAAARRIRARARARSLARVLNLTSARTLVEELELVGDRAQWLDLARALVLSLYLELDLSLANTYDRAHGDDSARDRALTQARARALDLDRGLASARNVARARVLTRKLVIDLRDGLDVNRARDHVLDIARDLARKLARELAMMAVDASGADLSDLKLSFRAVQAGLLAGVVWDEGTRWPSGLRARVVDQSEEIRSGVYRVRGGTERDPHAVPGP